MTPSEAPNMPRAQGIASHLYQQRSIFKKDQTQLTKARIRVPLTTGTHALNVKFDDGQHAIASFFQKRSYRFMISVVVSSNASMTVTKFTRYGHWPKFSDQGHFYTDMEGVH